MKRLLLLPYSMASESGRMLARSLNIRRIKDESRSHYRHRTGDVIVNWGCSAARPFAVDVNPPEAVARATNKVATFECLSHHGLRIPIFSCDPDVARAWMADGVGVYARRTLRGSKGHGLYTPSRTQSMDRGRFDECAFFTQKVEALREFRVHCSRGGRTLVQEKKRRNGYRDTASTEVRNHENHWVFCENQLAPYPSTLATLCRRAVVCLGLDFGAVDVALTSQGDIVMYEVNTAPGLTTNTLAWYHQTILDEVGHVSQ